MRFWRLLLRPFKRVWVFVLLALPWLLNQIAGDFVVTKLKAFANAHHYADKASQLLSWAIVHPAQSAAITASAIVAVSALAAWAHLEPAAARVAQNGIPQASKDVSAAAAQSFAPTSPVAQPKQEPRAHIELLEIRSAVIGRTGGIRYKWTEVQAGGYPAMIVVFRNHHAEVGDEAADARELVARMIYTPAHSKRVEINAGCWLNTAAQYVTLAPGEVAKLIVAVQLEKDQCPFALYNPRGTFPIYMSSRAMTRERVVHIESHQLSAVPCDLEIVLVAENRTLYRGCFELRQAREGAMQLDAKS
jgi:hypothetical protein